MGSEAGVSRAYQGQRDGSEELQEQEPDRYNHEYTHPHTSAHSWLTREINNNKKVTMLVVSSSLLQSSTIRALILWGSSKFRSVCLLCATT